MAHYAYLDDNNIVVAVTVGKDETELIDGLDTETLYALERLIQLSALHIITTYASNMQALVLPMMPLMMYL
jgi:hypothetical protein